MSGVRVGLTPGFRLALGGASFYSRREPDHGEPETFILGVSPESHCSLFVWLAWKLAPPRANTSAFRDNPVIRL